MHRLLESGRLTEVSLIHVYIDAQWISAWVMCCGWTTVPGGHGFCPSASPGGDYIHPLEAGALDNRLMSSHAFQLGHNFQVCHRDIKPENILLWRRDDLSIKLTDFG